MKIIITIIIIIITITTIIKAAPIKHGSSDPPSFTILKEYCI